MRACEIRINRARRLAARHRLRATLFAAALCLSPTPFLAPIGAQTPEDKRAAHEAPAQHGQTSHEEETHAESPWTFVWSLLNFALLAGGLYYLLRAPFTRHLVSRAETIRTALVDAESTRHAASAQLTEIDAKLQALPQEIDALKQRGVEEIAAEEARIHRAAHEERVRLLAQARRETDLALRVAKQELVEHAAALTVEVASGRLRADMTPADQQRLIARYVTRVRQPHD